MSMQALIYIVDDEESVRTSLATLLEIHGFAARAFDSGESFLGNVDPATTGCALVDVKMPGMDGIRLLERMMESGIRLPVVMMTGFGEVAIAVKAMKAGAADFLEKPLNEGELLAILNRTLSQSQASMHLGEQRAQGQARLARLTERERDVFSCLAMGKTNKAIARDLDISPRTVEIHRARVMEKLEASSLSELIRLALLLDERHGADL